MEAGPWAADSPVVRVGAAATSLGALLALGFSSFGVLLHYFVAKRAAASTQTGPHRRYPRVVQVVRAVGCVVLVVTLPPTSVLAGRRGVRTSWGSATACCA